MTTIPIGVSIPVSLILALCAAIAASRTERVRLQAARGRIAARHGLDEVWVSPVDGGFIGFAYRRGKVVLGATGLEAEHDLRAVAACELLVNGAVLGRTERDATEVRALPPTPSDAPIRSLALRVVVDSAPPQTHEITFLRWANRAGAPPRHAMAREARTQLDHMAGRLVDGLRKVRAEGPALV